MAQCAAEKNVDELVDLFSDLSEVPAKAIWDLVRQGSDEGLMILGKACGLGWPDMHKILVATMPGKDREPGRQRGAVSEVYQPFACECAARRSLHPHQFFTDRGRTPQARLIVIAARHLAMHPPVSL